MAADVSKLLEDVPGSTSELNALTQAGRTADVADGDMMAMLAEALQQRLAKAHKGGSPWLFGLDAKLAARRVARHMRNLAALRMESAKEWRTLWFTYQAYFVNTQAKEPQNGFDVDK